MEVIEITEREIEIIEVIERGPVGQTGPQPDINYTVVSSARTLEAADLIAADTSGGAFTLTLPLNPSDGDAVDIFDFSETFDTNPLTIARNGSRIESLEENLICNVEGAYFTLIYTGSTRGWQVVPRFGTSGGGGESTLTTQGDMLYRGAAVNTRLPIGSAGQILKVNSGATAPEWGAAPATGVTSVSGTAPITSSGGATPTISITAATTGAAGSMSSADKTKLDGIASGANNYTHPNHSGEVTSSGDGATTIANDVVTNAKLANMATATIKGRATASTGDPEDLSASSVRTLLNTDQVTDARTPLSHAHGALTNDGKVGTTANLPLKTGTNGVVEAGAFGTAAASFCEGNDARLSDDRDPNAHAASHAPASEKAIFKGQVAGMTTDVFIGAVTAGTAGDNIELNFDGVDSINTVIGAWNAANTSNTAELVSGNGSQVPNSGEQIVLLGGTEGGSDPLPYLEILASPSGVNKFKLGLGGDSAVGRFVGVSTAGDPLIGILSYADEETYNPANEVGSSAFGLTLGATATNLFAQYLQDGGLEATYNFPATGGTLVVDSDLGLTATSNSYDDLDDLPTLGTAAVEDTTAFAASGSITSSGLTQATARILGRTTASTGAVEEIQIGSGLSLSAGELSATGGSGVTAVGTTLADILSVSGSDLVADDLAADKLYGWDDSAGKAIGFIIGSGLETDTTTLKAKITSDPTGVTGADAITNIMSLTQAEYAAIGSPDAATLFLITDP